MLLPSAPILKTVWLDATIKKEADHLLSVVKPQIMRASSNPA